MKKNSTFSFPSNQETWSRFELIFGATLLTLCIFLLYRVQILNGFSVLSGDRYDGVISVTILEHWHNFYQGRVNWAEVGYFFPHSRSIAQSDAFFLIGIIYSPFRFLGFDPFLSAELANISLKLIGFTGTYVMCRRLVSFPVHLAMLAAVLFTLANGMTVHSGRTQIAAIAFTPWLALFISNGMSAMAKGARHKIFSNGALAGGLFGALCLTCFYIAWFFLFFFRNLRPYSSDSRR